MMSVTDLIVDAATPSVLEPKIGAAIALSGGGYRAMLFHTGVLWRLGQLGFFLDQPLQRVDAAGHATAVGKLERISSVSGGSIASAMLALAFPSLETLSGSDFDKAYADLVVAPLRKLASTTLAGTTLPGVFGVLKDVVLPGSVNSHVAKAYDDYLFKGKTLQDLPDRIRFVFNASNLQSGAVWRFSKPYMRDWRVGEVKDSKMSLAQVVGASSAFPPVLAPATLKLNNSDFTPNTGGANGGDGSLQRPPFTTEVTLADGGVYDNLGLETCFKEFKTLFVSNAGKPFEAQPSVSKNWLSIGNRCLDVMDNQVLSLRKRMLLQALTTGERSGAFWDIQQDIAVHRCANALPCPSPNTAKLAFVPTDLASKDKQTQERLINWGYAAADASVRAWFNPSLPPPPGFPYPASGV